MPPLPILFGMHQLKYGVPLAFNTGCEELFNALLSLLIRDRRRVLLMSNASLVFPVGPLNDVVVDTYRTDLPAESGCYFPPEVLHHYDVVILSGNVTNLLEVCIRAAATRTFVIVEQCYYWGGAKHEWVRYLYFRDTPVTEVMLQCPYLYTDYDSYCDELLVSMDGTVGAFDFTDVASRPIDFLLTSW